jgi:ABC-type antimicrobial peptide transport system permease subunit
MLVTASVTVSSYNNAIARWANQAYPGDLIVARTDNIARSMGLAFSRRDLTLLANTRGVRSIIERVGAGATGQIVVTASGDADLVDLRHRITQALAPDLISVQASREMRSSLLSLFSGTFVIAYALCSMSLLIAIVAMVNTLIATTLERKVEMGILRYIGLDRVGIQYMVLVESIVLAMLACFFGTFIGVESGLSLLDGAAQVNVAVVTADVPAYLILGVALLSFVAIVCAGIYPGLIVSRIRTDRAVYTP